MSPTQKRIFLAACVAIALTRFAAVAPALFDIDEAHFVSAVRDYDVTRHHPHPPGYPLFIAAAKGLHAAGVDEFRALQALVVIASMFVFPSLFWLARELGLDFATSAAGAAMFAFLPNVWLYGGTAFSDVPAVVVAFAACALLLRGRRDTAALVAGAMLLGVAAGIRPAHLLIGFVPALVATRARLRAKEYRALAGAIAAGAAIVLASYAGGAIASTGAASFIDSVRAQNGYVREIDSWRNLTRGSAGETAVALLLHPLQHRDVLNAIAIAAAVSLGASILRRTPAPLLTLATFAPIAVVTWLELDRSAAGRYSISFMAAHALLAADGFRVLFRRTRNQVAFASIVVGVLIVLAAPAVHEQRSTVPPPAAALRFAGARVEPLLPLYVHQSMRAQAVALLPRRELRFYQELGTVPGGAWVVDAEVRAGAVNFVRPRRGTWKVLRRRNFEASVFRR